MEKELILEQAKADARKLITSSMDKDKLIYHYTNIDAIHRGILVKNMLDDSKAICLFATDHRYLNDPNEIVYGHREMNDQCNTTRYITSFSYCKDSIPMWSTYGKNGNGIALGFDLNVVMLELKDVFSCIYGDGNDFKRKYEDKIINDKFTIRDLPTKTDFLNLLILLLCLGTYSDILKHPSYKYEKEVRFVTTGNNNVKYRSSNNLIIPYKEIFLPKKALKEIIVGPNLNAEMTCTSIEEYIHSLGFNNVNVVPSNAPYRKL